MKQAIIIAAFLLHISNLFAQIKDSTSIFVFPKHETKISYGDALNTNQEWETHYKANLSISYLYRHKKWLWFGINVVNYIGKPIHYDVREYNVNGKYTDYRYTTKDHGFGFIPAVRFSFLNKEKTTLYGGIEIGYSLIKTHTDGIPNKLEGVSSGQVTYFGWSSYLGENRKVVIGGEVGVGNRGIINIHAGYRF